MLSAIRKRLTYANVAMTLALVFAMTGGAYAANKYLITSTKQISPKVLKALKGKAGANGAQGPAGAAGAAGPQGPAGAAGAKGESGAAGAPGGEGKAGTNGENGKEGSPWTAGGTLPKGKTEKGTWALTAPPKNPTVSFAVAAISFVIPLEAEPEAHVLKETEKTPECPGTAAEPKAEPGQLCVYTESEGGISPAEINVTSHPFGAGLLNISSEPGAFAFGSWAVTAEA